jgi:hypothetical protein
MLVNLNSSNYGKGVRDMIDFWAVIGSRPIGDSTEIDSALEGVSKRLSSAAPDALVRFAERLAEALYRIDRRDFADIPVILSDDLRLPQTNDHFLYARCACVLAGEVTYEDVVKSCVGFDRFVSPFMQRAEGLLYIASEQYEMTTGSRMKTRTHLETDWMSNAEGWPE